MDREARVKIVEVLEEGTDLARLKQMILEYPESLNADYGCGSWLYQAAEDDLIDVVRLLIEMGADVNAMHVINGMTGGDTPLSWAASQGSLEVVKLLLSHGSLPYDEDTRIMLMVVQNAPKDKVLEIVKLLHQHGSDIHRIYMHEAINKPMNAFGEAQHRPDVVEYLASHGCTFPEEVTDSDGGNSHKQRVVDYFEREFGTVLAETIFEIVPADPNQSFDIHVVPKCVKDDTVVLFTTGLSGTPIAHPVDEGVEKLAELYIQLPAGWDFRDLKDPKSYWPVLWLQTLIGEFSAADAWLDEFTIFKTQNPVIPGKVFDSLLIMSDQEIGLGDAEIKLARLVPLHPGERQLEQSDGLPASLIGLDQANVSMTVDPQRKSFTS